MGMKKDLKETALMNLMNKVELPADAVDGVVNKRNVKLINTGCVSEDGQPIYGSILFTIHDPAPTSTHEGFDYEAAVAAYSAKSAAAVERKNKPKAGAAKDAATKERTLNRQKIVRNWWMTNAEEGRDYTSTEIFGLIPEAYEGDVRGAMVAGIDLKQLAGEGLAEMNVIEGKRCYHKK